MPPSSRRRHKKKARPRTTPLPTRSARLYVRLASRDIGLFRFLLEACDNLAYFTVIDKYSAVVRLRFSPDDEQDVRAFLDHQATALVQAVITPPLV
ncbi:DUF4911 domain-containing protein [Desulfovibrio inopinatus]|uniref:DUF4911 domain-containing protein n=1 Tax=Desulfovibrio inopinatus TaxID=102109 RepID=UPI000427C042|nr:DUF4911 domain-containing protein [Desulfovibrio inopinatus]